jgi:hypothetical protein
MIKIFTGLMLIFFTGHQVTAQSGQTLKEFERPEEVKEAKNYFLTKKSNTQLKEIVSNTRLVSMNFNADLFRNFTSKKDGTLEIEIPGFENLPIELELAPVTITSADFNVTQIPDKLVTQEIIDKSVFYRGHVKGDARSLASLSFVNNELSGMIIDSTGTRMIGKNQDPSSAESNYLLFYEEDITAGLQFLCGSMENNLTGRKSIRKIEQASENECKYLGVYLEADKSLYDKMGSKAAVTAYILGMFNQVATIFSAEGIAFRISGLYIWDTLDPYASSQTNLDDALSVFQNYWNAKNNNFPGQFAHLLTCRPLGGGNAYMEALDDRNKAYGVNRIYGNYKIVPAYSWDVKVLSHELGHNLGSPHTHSCTWPGGAIDNCAASEGDCATGPTPVNGGTIMSYCQNTSIGINLALGFGPLPGNLIRRRISNNTALPVSNTIPSELIAYDISARSARVKWNFTGANTTHTIQYKILSSTENWTELQTTKNTILLSGLLPNSTYSWRIKGNCSEYTEIQNFTMNNNQPLYCQPVDQCSQVTGIGLNAVSINNLSLSVSSGCATGGYNFNSTATAPQLTAGQNYAFNFGLIGHSFPQHLKVWIDYNSDGEFSTAELVAETKTSLTSDFSGKFKVPDNQIAITTRMRVRVNYFYQAFDACENLALGETEDYLINLLPATPLPVKFVTIGVSRQSNSAVLTWQTTDEDAGFSFDIEKSNNAKDFNTIGKIAGDGPSSQINRYTFSEELSEQDSSTVYYRVKMPDGSDKLIYSRIVALDNSALSNPEIRIWPNPFQNNLKFTIKTQHKGLINFTLYNIQGREIKSDQKYVLPGETNYEMKNFPVLSAGNYIIKIHDGKNSYSNVLIKNP